MLHRNIPSLHNKASTSAYLLPDAFVQEVRARANIREVIAPHVALKKAGASLVGLCPFHKERTPSFSVSEDKGFYHCFGCGESGDAIAFLTRYAGQSFREAVEELASSVGMSLPTGSTPQENFTSLYGKLELASKFYRHCLRHSDSPKEYLKSRGIVASTLQDFAIGYAPPGWQSLNEPFGDEAYARDPDLVSTSLVRDKDGRRYDVFRDRLMFAIKDTRGRIIGFGGRSMDGSDPKYMNSPESSLFDKSSVLFGFHEARSSILADKRAIVVEGYMDVVMLAQHGIRSVVATMGTACTPPQIERLRTIAPLTIFAFDGDAAGRKAAFRAMENALPFVTESHEFRFCFIPDGKDPDEYVQEHGARAFEDLLFSAMGLHQFFLTELSVRNNNLEQPEDRARFLAAGMDLIRRLPHGSPYYRLLRDEITKTSTAGAAYVNSLRHMRRRSAESADFWSRAFASIERFPAKATSLVQEVVDGLSDRDFALLESESFTSEQERLFWERFLALPEKQWPADEAPVNSDDHTQNDLVGVFCKLIQEQLTKQEKARINERYRRGEITEDEYIAARSAAV